jgi:uncharacterized FAD-dependent dehydrogenase
MYEVLHRRNVTLSPKGFAVGYRVEHPQSFVNRAQCVVQSLVSLSPPAPHPTARVRTGTAPSRRRS